jgi:hypothetical protein
MVDDVALAPLSQNESAKSEPRYRRSGDEESGLSAIQRDVEIAIQPKEEFESQREKARAQGSLYTHIWSESKVQVSTDDKK